ncbi:unnamed protein product [Arabidopsis thaliana]|uniref:(thale cress) hypothetical protein n=1 Tax=Arabidopsis thaliana TaxID=3702 RepID=A0A7G2E1L3_ARATH|nr:unnamed protein product [Arabidopsis thaliana]
MKTSNTAKIPGRLFHACPFGEINKRSQMFKWTDTCMVEESEDLIKKFENLGGTSITTQKGFNACESEIGNLTMETRVYETMIERM